MVICDEDIVTALDTILPCYYELFCDSETPKPCITYMPTNNNDDAVGTTIAYSRPRFIIKLWVNSCVDKAEYLKQIDAKMHSLGFKRINGNELTVYNQICAIGTYEALAIENLT